ncbi:MAG: O-antigen ligase family protein [Patescibacteria group bacterium]
MKKLPKTKSSVALFLESLPAYLLLLAPLVMLWNSSLSLYANILDKAFLFNVLVEIAFIVFALLYLSGRFKLANFRWNIIDFLLAGFGMVLILSTIFSQDLTNSLWGTFWRNDSLYQWLHYLLFYYLLRLTFASRSSLWIDWLVLNSLVAGIISAWIFGRSFIQFLFTNTWIAYASGPLSNLNFLAYYLALSIITTVALLLFNLKPTRRLVLGLLLLPQFYALWLTSGRAAYIALIAGFLVLLVIRFWPLFKKKFWLGWGLLTIILGFGLLAFAGFSRLATRLNEPALAHRVQAWQIGGEAFLEKPLLGWGLENFSLAFTKHYRPVFEDISAPLETWWYDRAHNFIVEYAVVAGLPGVILIVLLALFLFLQVGRYLWSKKKLPIITRKLAYLGLAGLVTYLVINLFGFDVIASYIVAIFIFALVASLGPTLKSPVSFRALPWIIVPLILVVLWASPQYTWRPWLLQRAAAVELRGIQRDELEQRFERIEHLVKNSLFLRRNFLPYLPIALSNSETIIPGFTEEQKIREIWPLVADLFYRYREDFKNDSRNLTGVALAYYPNADIDDESFARADTLLEQALALGPPRPFIYYYQALLYQKRNDDLKARDFFLQALTLNNQFQLAKFRLAITEGMLGDWDASDRWANEISSSDYIQQLAAFYTEKRDLPRLARTYQTILAQTPHDSQIRYNLGITYLEMGELEATEIEARLLLKFKDDAMGIEAGYNLLRFIELKKTQTDETS